MIFMIVPSIKFHGHPSSGSHADTCGKTNGHDEANICFSLEREQA